MEEQYTEPYIITSLHKLVGKYTKNFYAACKRLWAFCSNIALCVSCRQIYEYSNIWVHWCRPLCLCWKHFSLVFTHYNLSMHFYKAFWLSNCFKINTFLYKTKEHFLIFQKQVQSSFWTNIVKRLWNIKMGISLCICMHMCGNIFVYAQKFYWQK